MSNNYFNSTGTIGFTCDVCGRELQSCTWINGMRFCAKCYQETFGNNTSQFVDLLNKEMYELKIADLEAKLAESKKRIELADCIIKQYADKDKNLYLQLAEKDKGLNWLHQKFAKYVESNQDKISFALEQLEKVKNMLPEENIPIYPYEILHKLINQIEELKKEKN